MISGVLGIGRNTIFSSKACNLIKSTNFLFNKIPSFRSATSLFNFSLIGLFRSKFLLLFIVLGVLFFVWKLFVLFKKIHKSKIITNKIVESREALCNVFNNLSEILACKECLDKKPCLDCRVSISNISEELSELIDLVDWKDVLYDPNDDDHRFLHGMNIKLSTEVKELDRSLLCRGCYNNIVCGDCKRLIKGISSRINKVIIDTEKHLKIV